MDKRLSPQRFPGVSAQFEEEVLAFHPQTLRRNVSAIKRALRWHAHRKIRGKDH